MNEDTRPATLTCRDGVAPERLSAWRDGLLPPNQTAWLERHAPICPACSERLRDYDAARSALSGQVIPRPGADLWPGVSAAIEREMRAARGDTARRRLRLPRGMALGGLGAAVAALLLVALFAGLLINHRVGRPISAATPTVAQTPATTVTATPSQPGVWTRLTGCSNVPPRIRTIYSGGIIQQKSAPTIVALRRSGDCGQTWTDLTPPQITGVSYTSNVDLMIVTASPVNSQVAFLTLQITNPTTIPACSANSNSGLTLLHGGIAAAPAASGICQLQFVTPDGGGQWQPLGLPVPGVLGVMSAGGVSSLPDLLRAQGSLLYGVVTDWGIGSSGATPPGRLVVSDDGGVHWKSCDGALFTRGYDVWDFAVTATPAGSELYVIAEPINDPSAQAPAYSPTLSVWSSADNGLTWTEGGPTPGSGASPGQGGYATAMSAGVTGGQPVVYVIVASKGSAQLFASLDGGQRWQASDPLNPGGGALASPELLGTLADGSAVIEQAAGGVPTLAWKPGSAPRQIAQNANLQMFSNPVFQRRPDGVYLWLTGYNNTDTGQVVMYTLLQ